MKKAPFHRRNRAFFVGLREMIRELDEMITQFAHLCRNFATGKEQRQVSTTNLNHKKDNDGKDPVPDIRTRLRRELS